MWILVILLDIVGSNYINSINIPKFTTQQSCENAAKTIYKKFDEWGVDIKYTCVHN